MWRAVAQSFEDTTDELGTPEIESNAIASDPGMAAVTAPGIAAVKGTPSQNKDKAVAIKF